MVRRMVRAYGRRVADESEADLAEMLLLREEVEAAIAAAVRGQRQNHGQSWAYIARADDRTALMVRLAGEAGLRRAEVAQVHARDLMEDLTGWSLLVHGKGDRERVMTLSRPLATLLRARLLAVGGGYAFPGDDDGHLSPRWVGRLVADALPEGWTMHTLRHRFATRFHEASGRDVFLTQEALGHASPVTTQRYVAVGRDRMRAVVEALA